MKKYHLFAWIWLGCICLIGLAYPIKAQTSRAFQAVALHLAPGNLAVMEYRGTPASKGTVLIELPLGLTPDRVYCSPESAFGPKPGVQNPNSASDGGTSNPATTATGSSSINSNGNVPRLMMQILRDSARLQRTAGDLASLIALNTGRSVSVETFDGSENIGYRGTILGIDPRGEVLTLSDAQEIHNIPVRQIMYWSAESDWKQTQEFTEPSRYQIRLMAPDGWDGGSVRVWVHTKNVDCGYTYRLKTAGRDRMALDLSLQTSFAFDELELVGHANLNFHAMGETNDPYFRIVAPKGTAAGLWCTTVREDEVSLLLKEEWNFGAVALADSHFFQSPSIRSILSIKAHTAGADFMSIPTYMEDENHPPILMHPIRMPGLTRELLFELGKPVLIGVDSGTVRRGRQYTESNKPVGPEGWWVNGRIEADYVGDTPVEWTIRRSFLPENSGQKNQQVTVLNHKNPNAVARELTKTITLNSENRYGFTYSYFLAPLQKGR